MKGILITAALILGLGVFAITNTDKIVTKMAADLVKKEGGEPGRPAFNALKFENPAEFTKKFQEVLDRRLQLIMVAHYVGKGPTALQMAKETKDLYLDAPVKKSNRFGRMLIVLAEDAEDWNRGAEAFELYGLVKEHVPNHPEIKRIDNVMQKLRIKYGIQ